MQVGRSVSMIRTGIPGLDEILHGGIPRENSVLVKGPPGSGKTTLAMQFIRPRRNDQPFRAWI